MKNLRCEICGVLCGHSLMCESPEGRRLALAERRWKRCFACIELAEAEEWYAQQREMMAERAPA